MFTLKSQTKLTKVNCISMQTLKKVDLLHSDNVEFVDTVVLLGMLPRLNPQKGSLVVCYSVSYR